MSSYLTTIKLLKNVISNQLLTKNISTAKMAKSKFEYVKDFEKDEALLPNCWIVVRIDGKGFHKFATAHDFQRPNDIRSLSLMNRAAHYVMKEFHDIILAYGQSDEYSFILRKSAELYNRRSCKIMSNITSMFTSLYVYHWSKYFDIELKYAPSFDGRCVLYPSDRNLIDYLSWRQADVHINNLYNTTFWNLVQSAKMTPAEAEKRLRGTVSSDKNEILYSQFNINYNNEPPMFRKGTTLLKKEVTNPHVGRSQRIIINLHEDMIKEKFWKTHSELLDDSKGQLYELSGDVGDFVQEQIDNFKQQKKAT